MHCVQVKFQKNLQLVIRKKKTGLKDGLFSVAVNPIDTNILDIHRYLMKGT